MVTNMRSCIDDMLNAPQKMPNTNRLVNLVIVFRLTGAYASCVGDTLVALLCLGVFECFVCRWATHLHISAFSLGAGQFFLAFYAHGLSPSVNTYLLMEQIGEADVC